MGVKLTFFQTFLASTIPYIAYVVPIPGGLGLLEGGHAAVFAALGVNINAFVLVFIIRMRDLVFVLAGLVHASKRSLTLLKESYKSRRNKPSISPKPPRQNMTLFSKDVIFNDLLNIPLNVPKLPKERLEQIIEQFKSTPPTSRKEKVRGLINASLTVLTPSGQQSTPEQFWARLETS